MSDEVYFVYHDDMRQPNAGALGTPSKPVNDVRLGMKVPDGMWMVFARIEVNNNEPKSQLVTFALTGDGGWAAPHDVARVKVGPQAQADYASVSLMVPMHFPGTNTNRVNGIFLGLYDTGAPPSIEVGRAKITAMRVNAFLIPEGPFAN